MPDAPLPFGPWWEVYRRLVGGGDDFPVVPAALAMSHILQGGDTWPDVEPRLRDLEQVARRRSCKDPAIAAHGIVGLLVEEGIGGNTRHYEDPANSYLDRVLERSCGLPIALSVLAVHLARHIGVPLRGIGFPGHFMVGLHLDGPNPLVLDPFNRGRMLDGDELDTLLTHATGHAHPPQAWRRWLRPASGREILMRMLRNLVIHLHHAEQPEHATTAERLLELTATPQAGSGPSPAD
ncbi:MAG: transglutaminase-like domain-containing protein [Myxococcota bacterium]